MDKLHKLLTWWFSWLYFAFQRWRKGSPTLYPGFAWRPPSSWGYFQGFGYLSQSESWTEASGKTSHRHTRQIQEIIDPFPPTFFWTHRLSVRAHEWNRSLTAARWRVQLTLLNVSGNTHITVAPSKTISHLLLHLHALSASVSQAHKTC